MNTNLPLDKNPAWVHMADYGCFNDALAAMRYYDERHARWLSFKAQVKHFMLALFNIS